MLLARFDLLSVKDLHTYDLIVRIEKFAILPEWTATEDEKNSEEEVLKLEGEEKESLEEVVEQADKGQLLVVRRALIGFSRIQEEPKDDSLPTKAETTLIPTASDALLSP